MNKIIIQMTILGNKILNPLFKMIQLKDSTIMIQISIVQIQFLNKKIYNYFKILIFNNNQILS